MTEPLRLRIFVNGAVRHTSEINPERLAAAVETIRAHVAHLSDHFLVVTDHDNITSIIWKR